MEKHERCQLCGAIYDTEAPVDHADACPGTDADRIAALEEAVDDLCDHIKALMMRVGVLEARGGSPSGSDEP